MAPFFQSKQSAIRALNTQEAELKNSILRLEDAYLSVMFKQIAEQLRASVDEYGHSPMSEELKSYAEAFETMDFSKAKFAQRRQELRILHGLHNTGFTQWVENDIARISGNRNLSAADKNRIYLTRLADMLLNSNKPATTLGIDSSGKVVERDYQTTLRSELSTKGALLGMGNHEQALLSLFRSNFPTTLRDNLYDVQALSGLIDEHRGIRPINSTDISNVKNPVIKALNNVWNAISFKWLRTKPKDVLEAEQKVKLVSEKKSQLVKAVWKLMDETSKAAPELQGNVSHVQSMANTTLGTAETIAQHGLEKAQERQKAAESVEPSVEETLSAASKFVSKPK